MFLSGWVCVRAVFKCHLFCVCAFCWMAKKLNEQQSLIHWLNFDFPFCCCFNWCDTVTPLVSQLASSASQSIFGDNKKKRKKKKDKKIRISLSLYYSDLPLCHTHFTFATHFIERNMIIISDVLWPWDGRLFAGSFHCMYTAWLVFILFFALLFHVPKHPEIQFIPDRAYN